MPPTGSPMNLHDDPSLRDRTGVYASRAEAGEILAGMLQDDVSDDAIVVAVPAGGLPVALAIARRLGLPVRVAVVSKITLPWNTEVGYGAVAFDGSYMLNDSLIRAVGLTDQEVREGIRRTRQKVERRVEAFGECGLSSGAAGANAILVDDGLASGFTMRTAVAAARRCLGGGIILAVPTAPKETADFLAPEVDMLCCPNITAIRPFAVADAYRNWRDVSEEESIRRIQDYRQGHEH